MSCRRRSPRNPPPCGSSDWSDRLRRAGRSGSGGLWRAQRWAEYLTFIATTLLLIPEIYELTGAITITKIITLIINLVVVGYLLFAKRLFGLRGGGRAETAQRDRDSGWAAVERSLPAPTPPRDTATAQSTEEVPASPRR